MKNSSERLNLQISWHLNQPMLFSLFFSILLFVGCKQYIEPDAKVKDVEQIAQKEETSNSSARHGKGYTQPYLTGTFVDFWYKSNWSQAQWNAHLAEMQLVGVQTLIVQFSAYGNYIWCNSSNNYSTELYPNALPRLLQAANQYGMKVYVGLYFNENFWSNTQNTSLLQLHANRSKQLATNIWNQYGSNTSFAGWYISHEPAPYYFNTASKFNTFKNNLVNPIANHCKNISGKPVAIAAFFNESLSTSIDLLYFMNRLGGCNLDVIMLQDGTGASEDGVTPHVSIGNLQGYFNNANWGLYGESPVFHGEFWADVETFKPNTSPETFNIIVQKFNIVDAYVTKIVTFQYYKDMGIDSPHTGANQVAADALRNQYRQYYFDW